MRQLDPGDGAFCGRFPRSRTSWLSLGAVFGKQAAVFLFSAAAIRAGWAKLPKQAGRFELYGVAFLCGIGFTMSLFIGLLAFPSDPVLQDETKLGVLLGSVVSALAAVLVFRLANRQPSS